MDEARLGVGLQRLGRGWPRPALWEGAGGAARNRRAAAPDVPAAPIEAATHRVARACRRYRGGAGWDLRAQRAASRVAVSCGTKRGAAFVGSAPDGNRDRADPKREPIAAGCPWTTAGAPCHDTETPS